MVRRRQVLRTVAAAGLILPLVGWRWPWDVNRLAERADEAYRAGRYDEAARDYGEALGYAAGSPELAYNLGTSYLQNQDYGTALEVLGRALELARTPAMQNRTHYNRGNAFYRLGRIEEAAGEYQKALEADPGDEDAAYNLELCRRRQPPSGGQGDRSRRNQQGGRQNQGGQQNRGGQGQPNSQPRGAAPPSSASRDGGSPMSESQVDRKLESLARDERDFREYFTARPSLQKNAPDPFDPSTSLDEMLKGMSGADSGKRDW